MTKESNGWRTNPIIVTVTQCDNFQKANIAESYQDEEKELMKTKWFDYRHLHPVQATDLFAQQYRKAYREYTKRRKDYLEVHNGSSDDITSMSKRKLTALTKARRAADRHCIPYDLYISAAFDWAESRIWKRIPMPNHLYGELCLAFILKRWQNILMYSLHLPSSETFYAHHYNQEQHQIAFYKWLSYTLSQKRSAEYALHSLMYDYNIISKDVAYQYFDTRIILLAEKIL